MHNDFDKYIYLDVIHPMHIQLSLNYLLDDLTKRKLILKKKLQEIISDIQYYEDKGNYCHTKYKELTSKKTYILQLIIHTMMKIKLAKSRIKKTIK